MKKYIFVFAFVLSVGLSLKAQEETFDFCPENTISISYGTIAHSSYGNPTFYEVLTPNSEVLQMALGNNITASYFVLYEPNTTFSLNWEHLFKANPDTKWSFPSRLRVGFTFANMCGLYSGGYKQEQFPYDTLTSTNGDVYYRDSIHRSTFDMRYCSDEIRLNVVYFVTTNPEKRWSFYSGMGANFGISYNAYAVMKYNEYYDIQEVDEGVYSSFGSFLNLQDNYSERIQTNNNVNFTVSIPLGVDFRVGKKREFLTHLHLFMEYHPGVNGMFVKDLDPIFTRSNYVTTGFRIVL